MLFLLAEGILLRGLWTYYLSGSTPKMDEAYVWLEVIVSNDRSESLVYFTYVEI